ncbi:Ig-like domain-containing protein [Marinomonas primoryensis]|uniref:Ig-like domain-containing protein n=1 Tax=Marinomonas primoryensis TaxID=178399 RepID=A0ABV0KZJ3_9GAMM
MVDEVMSAANNEGSVEGQGEAVKNSQKMALTDQDNAFFEQAKAVFYGAFYSGKTAEQALGAASDKLDELSASINLKDVSLDLLNDIDFSHLQQEYNIAPFNIVTGCESVSTLTEQELVSEDSSPFKNDVLCIVAGNITVNESENDGEALQTSTTLTLSQVEETNLIEVPESVVVLTGNEDKRGEEIAFSGVESILDDMEQLGSSLKSTHANRDTFDTIAPEVAISAVIDDVGSVIGSLSSGDSTDDTYLLLSGVVETGSTVTIYNGGVEVGKATVTGSFWSYTVTINNGVSYQFNAKATDAAGNESAATSNFIVTGDTVAPVIAMTAVTDDAGVIQGTLTSGDRTDDTRLKLSGTAEMGSTVTIYNGSVEVGKATVTGSSWSYTVTINNGVSYQFNARATDAAGNESAATSNFLVTGDTVAPSASQSNAIEWDISQGDSSTVLDAGDTVTVALSEAVKVADLALSDFVLSDGHSFGAGATLSASDDDGDGYADTYKITLGTSSSATTKDKITIAENTLHDKAGNLNEEIGVVVDTSIVVFDLTAGTSSSHSNRTFLADEVYTIYIVVNSDAIEMTMNSTSLWSSAGNLGADDKIVLVGNDGTVVKGASMLEVTQFSLQTPSNAWYVWGNGDNETALAMTYRGQLTRVLSEAFTGAAGAAGGRARQTVGVDIWAGTDGWDYNNDPNKGLSFNEVYVNQLPASVAATQPMS